MVYYKILKNNQVIDVNYKFFRYQRKHMNLVHCEEGMGELIQSSDGKNFYMTEWTRPLPVGVHHEWIKAVIISEEEYNSLKEQLELNEVVVEVAQEETPVAASESVEQPVEVEQVVSIRDLYEEIKRLKEELNSIKK